MVQTIKINLSGKKDEKLEGELSKIQVGIREEELSVTGIPDKDTIEYLARSPDSRFFVVHRPKKNWNYDYFRLHIGLESQLREAKVINVKRMRDGGTTYITYKLNEIDGSLYFPTPFKKEARPTDTYNGKTVTLEKLI